MLLIIIDKCPKQNNNKKFKSYTDNKYLDIIFSRFVLLYLEILEIILSDYFSSFIHTQSLHNQHYNLPLVTGFMVSFSPLTIPTDFVDC